MEAKLFFYLNSDTIRFPNRATQDRVKGFVRSSFVSDEDKEWYNEHAASMGLPPNLLGCLDFEKQRGQWLMHDPNHKLFDFGPDGFELPSFMLGRESQIEYIEAEIYFFSKGKLILGRYAHQFISESKWKSVFNFFRWLRSVFSLRENNWDGIHKNTRGVLHYELLNDGRPRYWLLVRQARNFGDLYRFVTRVRAKQIQPSEPWS